MDPFQGIVVNVSVVFGSSLFTRGERIGLFGSARMVLRYLGESQCRHNLVVQTQIVFDGRVDFRIAVKFVDDVRNVILIVLFCTLL